MGKGMTKFVIVGFAAAIAAGLIAPMLSGLLGSRAAA
jgi:hypothetical protein